MKKLLVFFLFLSLGGMAQQPVFRTGKHTLESFLASNTVYPAYSRQNCIGGTVVVAFKLDKKGDVFSSRVVRGVGTDLDDEALRLVRMTRGKWSLPAGFDTTTLVSVPVNFKVSGANCDQKSVAEIRQAIQAYRNEQELTNAVLNYYRNKEQGKAPAGEEQRIRSIQQELGYDDEYYDQRISAGLKKIKQGDHEGACEDFRFVKYMGSSKADTHLEKYCR
ncbi:energy transducer TonB [Pedobacter yulinensis]|uniref:Energy transducer TonB n=1 Tax=Pedobacter yulinensis TaxID=2126353 RepID=A0A2T3HRW3_9SPHI|nr:TonB family protein [Pedobacter yulinensis]PST85205.1 energy transducer TonB [Pedobacter yulinensis]